MTEELRSHAYGYALLGLFTLAGPLVTLWFFPEAPSGLGVVGGLAFGIHAALCAVPNKLI
jgi:hypothetical protein